MKVINFIDLMKNAEFKHVFKPYIMMFSTGERRDEFTSEMDFSRSKYSFIETEEVDKVVTKTYDNIASIPSNVLQREIEEIKSVQFSCKTSTTGRTSTNSMEIIFKLINKGTHEVK